jgi:Domain of unknown function (DUF6933)
LFTRARRGSVEVTLAPVVVRCTGKLLTQLGKPPVTLVEAPASSDDWYANLLWLDRRKCLLIAHAGTLFSLFVADLRVRDLRPFERRIVDLLTSRCSRRDYRSTRSAAWNPVNSGSPKTASRHVLGVMNQMAFEIGWHADQAGGLWNVDVDELNRHLRRSLHTKDGDTGYRSSWCTNDSTTAGKDLSPVPPAFATRAATSGRSRGQSMMERRAASR